MKSSSRGNAALTSARTHTHARVLFRTANPYKSVTQLFNSLKCGFVGEFQHNLEPEPPVISCNYVAGSATRDNKHKVIKRKAALSKNINRFYAEFEPLMVTMTGRQMSTFVTLWIIQRALIHYNVSSIKMDARWSCFFFSQHGLFFGQWAVLLYLHGNGSTSDFKQSSEHACTKHINYLPPVHTVACMLTSCLAVQGVLSPPPLTQYK